MQSRESSVYKQVHQQTANKNCHSFFFLFFSLMTATSQKETLLGGGSRQTLYNKNTTKTLTQESADKEMLPCHTEIAGLFPMRKPPGVRTRMAISAASAAVRDEEG